MVQLVSKQSVVAALLAVAVSGCAATTPAATTPLAFADPPSVSAEASAMYGDAAEDAYAQVTDVLLEYSTPTQFLEPDAAPPIEADLNEGIPEAMTSATARVWEQEVAAALSGDAEAVDAVNLLRLHDLDTTWATRPRRGEILSAQRVSEGLVALGEPLVLASSDDTGSGDGTSATTDAQVTPLVISLVHTATIRLEAEGEPYQVIVTRPLTITVVPDGDRWRIATFTGTLSTETLMGDPPGAVDETSATSGR